MKLHANIKAASRAEAFEIIQSCMNDPDDYPKMSRKHTEMLYKYFMPKYKKRKAKSDLEWVAKAAASSDKKEIRRYFAYLYSDGNRICASNGYRLHITETDLPEGYYCPITFNPVDCDASYPEIDRIIPDNKKTSTYLIEDMDQISIDKKIALGLNNQWFQEKYIKEACNNSDNICLSLPMDKNTAAYGVSDFGEFVIMPMRI